MIDAIKGVFNAISMIIDAIVFVITSVFDFLGMLLKSVVLIGTYYNLLPIPLQLFAAAFMLVFVVMMILRVVGSFL